LECEENVQHSKEDIGGSVDSLEVKQGVQDMKMTKPQRRNSKRGHHPMHGGAPPGCRSATKQRADVAREKGGTGQHRVHRPGHRRGVAVHRTGGGGATRERLYAYLLIKGAYAHRACTQRGL